MIRQQWLMLWSRRHANGLIVAEVCVAAILAFVILAYALHYSLQLSQPLGYEYEDVYAVTVSDGFPRDPAHNERVGQLVQALRARPDVESASAGGMFLFQGWVSESTWDDEEGNDYTTRHNNFELRADEVLGLDVVDGRWFAESDLGRDDLPVVVNEAFVKRNLDVDDPIGASFLAPRGDPEEGRRATVIGVVSAFKQYSPLVPDSPYMINLSDTAPPGESSANDPLLYLLVRKSPNAGPSFISDITQSLKMMAPDLPIRVQSLSRLREIDLTRRLRPLRVGALVGGFFLLLVCFGLFGIFWQSVTTRTRELGLKRALGLSSVRLIGHFILEHGIISVAALVIATVVLLHLPLTGWLEFLDVRTFALSLAAVWVLLLGLTALCAAYPAWHAARVAPAEALRYE